MIHHRLLFFWFPLQIKVIVTENAKHFVDVDEIPPDVPIHTDADEWTAWTKRGDPVLHIDLTKWADVFVIAPLDANSLAKMAQVQLHHSNHFLVNISYGPLHPGTLRQSSSMHGTCLELHEAGVLLSGNEHIHVAASSYQRTCC